MEKETGPVIEYKTGGGRAHYILIICTLLYMVNFMDRQLVAAVVEPMKAALGLSDGDVGIVGTVFLISLALFSSPISYVVDRWSRRKAIAVLAVIWSAFTFATGTSKTFWTLLIPRSLVAVGQSGFAPGGTAMIGAAYPQKSRGIVMGIFNTAIPLGVALGTLLGGTLAKLYGWQAPFYIFAIPGIILGILALFMKDYKSAAESPATTKSISFRQSLAVIFRIPTMVWVFAGYGVANIMSLSFMFWGPAFIGRAWGVDVQAANAILVPIVLAAIAGAPLGGLLSDLWFRKNPRGRLYLAATTIMISALVIAGAVYLQFKGPIGMTLAILYGALNVMFLPCVSAVSQDVVPIAHKGMVWGVLILCVNIFGGGWSPYMVGAISDALGQGAGALGTALMIASAGGLLGGFCYLAAARFYPGDMEKVKGERLIAER